MKVTAKKAMLIGLASSTLFGLAGCTTDRNIPDDVYGPPMYLEDNVEGDVYGPPLYQEDMMDEETEDAEDTAEDENSAGEEDK